MTLIVLQCIHFISDNDVSNRHNVLNERNASGWSNVEDNVVVEVHQSSNNNTGVNTLEKKKSIDELVSDSIGDHGHTQDLQDLNDGKCDLKRSSQTSATAEDNHHATQKSNSKQIVTGVDSCSVNESDETDLVSIRNQARSRSNTLRTARTTSALTTDRRKSPDKLVCFQ